jgi:hypothetical protein
VCQVYYAPRECFKRDERCRRPIQHRFSFHFESSFRLRSSATLSHCSSRGCGHKPISSTVEEANQVFPRLTVAYQPNIFLP